ncbi:transcription initiation factor TFIID subunit 2-like [Physella acuta]|uniref:transcription initiation factor TFIID subunit 2-like n=1 Tax=Physella acuta TaxID=109671 RepID=UPI0027DE38FF|nr:transcription initiation factor TFIID subunit 2-like [Physella acuta]
MKKDTKPELARLFKVSHQILCINGINFDNKSLVGYVELTVWPTVPDLTEIRINSKQCIIYRVSIDKKWDAEFTYFDPTLNICQGNPIKRNIDYFQKCQKNALNAVDPDLGNGELIITFPKEILSTVSVLGSFQVCVEFGLKDAQGGVHFVVPDMPGTVAERGSHMFTYSVENFARLWFPCVDSCSEPCTWKIEVTVDRDMTAISCGDLVSVEFTEDMLEKTYHYFLSTPVAAPNIALAVGPFEILVDPKMHEVTHFCLPKLMPVLKHTTSYIHQAFEFYEELMSSRYPYSYYKQVFVDQAYCEVATYSTMSILSTNLLHPPNIIDQTMASRQLMATAVAQQFFGSFIAMESWTDAWLTKGITGYLSYLFSKRTFGNNEYRNWVMRDLLEVSEYEQNVGYVILDPTKRDGNHPFSVHSPHTLSPRYSEIFCKKARLVVRMLEIKIGTELLLQVLNKLLSLAYNASQQTFGLTSWTNMLLSTSSFLKIIFTVTGKDIEPFIDIWVYQGGCARFTGNFVFNRKRNVVELDIRQDLNAPGALKYVGTLNVTIQELDGSFNHQFKIEENKTKFEITCHSKSRRNKRKKIPLMTGEEVDMDLSAMDADSPVLWLRLDPDMHLLRTVNFEQPDYMWQYQLRFERCIVAQFEAIDALGKFPTPASRAALTDTIENEECYYRVRQDACYCLAKIANLMIGTWTGPPAMIAIFRKMFGSHSCPFIVRQNNFSNFQHYYLLKTMPQAMARLRDTHNLCLAEITKFLLDLFKYNDNSRNKWSDNYYRAALVEALSASITPAVTNVSLITGQVVTSDTLSTETKQVLEEVVRCLNLEKLMPCYRYTVTVSCLYTIRTLQKLGHLPIDSDVFKDYAQPGIFRDVRVAAITCLVDFIRGDLTGDHLRWVLDFILNEKDPYLRHHTVTCLTQNPPFRRSERSALNIEPLVEKLWDMMCHVSSDSRLRCGLADLYFTLYGRQRPTCLPIPENVKQTEREKKSEVPSDDLSVSLTPHSSIAVWNPELSSIFASPVHDMADIIPPSIVQVNLDGVDDNLDQTPVDLSMISGEQTVALEESVVTEPLHPHLQPSELTMKLELEQLEAAPVHVDLSQPNSVSGLSEESLSPCHSVKGHPDDVIISLDNVIKRDPTGLTSSNQMEDPQDLSPCPAPDGSSPLMEPKSSPGYMVEEEKPEVKVQPLEFYQPQQWPVVKEEVVVKPDSPFSVHSSRPTTPQSPIPTTPHSHPPTTPQSPPPTTPQSPPPTTPQSPTPTTPQSPPPTTPPQTRTRSPPLVWHSLDLKPEFKYEPSPSPPTLGMKPEFKYEPSPSPPTLGMSPPLCVLSPGAQSHPTMPVLQLTDVSSPPHSFKRKLSGATSMEGPESKKIPPLIVSTSMVPSSSAHSSSAHSSLTEPPKPSLKTIFNLSAAVAASEARDRERAHHKSKKKKKKNKHKHKHKHKHEKEHKDRGGKEHKDRGGKEHKDRGGNKDKHRERLVLDLSEIARGSRESSASIVVDDVEENSSE